MTHRLLVRQIGVTPDPISGLQVWDLGDRNLSGPGYARLDCEARADRTPPYPMAHLPVQTTSARPNTTRMGWMYCSIG